ncbi:MAG TPA: hypothetical protein VKU84_15850 [Stellaceae bacterium]|nr:hypothetical protein [Stellaceae bacterium]
MALPRIGGSGIPLSLSNLTANRVRLQAGQAWILPSGTFWITPGRYTYLQFLDPVQNVFQTSYVSPGGGLVVDSDGANWRLANLTGCVRGGLITTAGSGLTNGFGTVAITPSAGASVWQSIVGGAIGTSPTIVAGGANYTYPPIVVIGPPPQGGFTATAHATLSAGAVNAVVIDNQGAGYVTAPPVYFINDPRDTTGAGASATVALTGSGTLTGMYPTNHGTVLTAVPTFTFSPASTIAATAIMNFVVTAYAVTTAGSTYAAPVEVRSAGNLVAGTSVLTNPLYTTGLTQPRVARINAALSSGGFTATGQIVEDAGLGIQAVPTALILTQVYPTIADQGALTLAVGGINDDNIVQPI